MNKNTMDWNRLTYLFVGEVNSQCQRASFAMSKINEESTRERPSSAIVHGQIENFVDAAHRVSLALFPAGWRKKRQSETERFAAERARHLREALNCLDTSPLSGKAMRNHMAHYDERIDLWFKSSLMQTFGRNMLGGENDLNRLGISKNDVMSMYDPRTGKFLFWEDELNLFEIDLELRNVELECRRFLGKNEYPGRKEKPQ